MRVLILTPEFRSHGGGVATFYNEVVPALRAAGAELRIIEGSAMHARDDREAEEQDGIAVETLEASRLARWRDRFANFAAAPGLRRHLAAAWAMWEQADFGADADIVEASDWGLLFLPPALEATRPLVVQCHGSVGQISVHDPMAGEEIQGILARLIEQAVMPMATAVQTCSKANAAFWRCETGREAEVIRPACSVSAAYAPSLSKAGLVVGRVQRWKGPQIVCEALESLGSRAPAIDWVGRDTAWDASNNSAISHLGRAFPHVWGKTVQHSVPVASAEVLRRQAAALFNLVPSIWDVFNFTAVEAMASGRPTIVSNGAGASELIEDGVNGYLFEAGDADSLAAVLDCVLSQPESRRAEIGRAAQETIRRELAPETIAPQRLAAYGAAMASFAANPPSPASGWIGEICRPMQVSGQGEMSFLEHLPLRELTAHVADRLSRRILSRRA